MFQDFRDYLFFGFLIIKTAITKIKIAPAVIPPIKPQGAGEGSAGSEVVGGKKAGVVVDGSASGAAELTGGMIGVDVTVAAMGDSLAGVGVGDGMTGAGVRVGSAAG